MKKLDSQVQTSYSKMLESSEEPPATVPQAKQSIFSPARAKQMTTPIKKVTFKTPSKTEIENQR